MKVMGFNFTKISVERPEKMQFDGKINANLEFTNADKTTLGTISSNEYLKLNFRYTISYQKNDPNVLFEGSLIVEVDPETITETLKTWKKKQVPEKIRIPLLNSIMYKCNLRALQLEEEVNLPPHFRLPRVSAQPQKPN